MEQINSKLDLLTELEKMDQITSKLDLLTKKLEEIENHVEPGEYDCIIR